MAEDIASLGIAVDTTQIKQADRELDKLSATAGRTGAAAESMRSRFDTMNAAMAKMAASIEQQTRLQQSFAKSSGISAKTLQEINRRAAESVAQQEAMARAVTENTTALSQLAKTIEEVATKQREHTRESKSAASAADTLRNAVKLLAAAYGAWKIGSHVKETAMLHARYETLGVVMGVVGRNAGLMQHQMDSTAAALQKSGISMIESRQQAIKLVQANIDLSNATKLARIAQDAAVIGNVNSSEAFARLIHGIQTYQPEVLRTIGINVSMEQAFQKMASTLGKNTDNLSQAEKTQAVLNAVMEAGAGIAGTYEAAMDTAGKQIGSLSRLQEDLKVKLGEVWNDALIAIVMSYTNGLKGANKAMDDMANNDSLDKWAKGLGNIVVTVLNGINNIIVGLRTVKGFWDELLEREKIDQWAKQEKDKIVPREGLFGTRNLWELADPKKREAFENIDRDAERLREQAKKDRESFIDGLRSQVDSIKQQFDSLGRTRVEKERKANEERLSREQEFARRSIELQKKHANDSIAVQQAAQKKLVKEMFFPDQKISGSGGSGSTNSAAQAKKQENDLYRSLLAEQDQLFKLEQANLKTNLTAIEHSHRMGLTSTRTMLEQKMALQLQEIAAEEKAVKAKLSAAIQKKDVEDQRRFNHDLAMLAEERQRVEIETSQKIAEARQQEIQKSDEAVEKYLNSKEQTLRKLQEENAEFGKSKALLEQEEAARIAVAAAATEELMAMRMLDGARDEEIEALKKQLTFLRQLQKVSEETATAIENREALQEAQKAAENATKEWKSAFDKIEDWITDAIMRGFDGGKSFVRNLIDSIKHAFARLILQPIIAPIAAIGASIYSGGGMTGGGIGGGNSLVGLGQQAYSYYNALSNAGGLAGMIGSNVASYGTALNSPWMSNFGVGMQNPSFYGGMSSAPGVSAGQFAGAAANWAGGVGLGIYGGRAISGGYSAMGGSSGNTAVNAGTAIGAIWGPLGAAIGGAIGGVINRAFGRGPKQVTGSGMEFNYTPQTGMDAFQYTEWKQKGGWFRSDRKGRDINHLNFNEADAMQQQLFAIRDSINLFTKEIGDGTQQIDGFAANLRVVFQNTGDAQADAAVNQQRYQEVLQGFSDYIARGAVQGIDAYRMEGENATQTLMRLSQMFKLTNEVMAMMGRDGTSAFGAIGLASTRAREQLIMFAGGIDALASQVSFYLDNFLTDHEKLEAMQRQLSPIMQQLGISSISTKQEFSAVVKSLDLATESGRRMFASMMQLAPAFNELALAQERMREEAERQQQELMDHLTRQTEFIWENFTDDAAKLARARQTVTSELSAFGKGWIDTQDEFLTELSNAQLNGWFDPLYRKLLDIAPVFKQMLELQQKEIDLKKQAYEDEKRRLEENQDNARRNVETVFRRVFDALREARDKFSSLSDTIRKFSDSLLTSDMSPLTPMEQYNVAKTRFDSVRDRAMAGDVSAMEELESVSSQFLDLSRQMFASSEQYTNDFARVRDALALGANVADAQKALMQRQLDMITAQTQGILDMEGWLDDGFNILVQNNYDRLIAVQNATTDVATAVRDYHSASIVLNEHLRKTIIDTSASSVPPPAPPPPPPPAPPPPAPAPAPAPVVQPAPAPAPDPLAAKNHYLNELLGLYQLDTGTPWHQYQFDTSSRLMDQGWDNQRILNAYLRRDIGYRDQTLASFGVAGNPLWIQLMDSSMQVNRRYMSLLELQATHQAGISPFGTDIGAMFQFVMGLPDNAYAATGVDYVPYDGFKISAHRGERLLTNTQARMMDMDEGELDLSRFSRRDSGYDALCSEVRALREENRKLREESAEQVAAMVSAMFASTDRAADKVVEGSKEAAKTPAWDRRIRGEFN